MRAVLRTSQNKHASTLRILMAEQSPDSNTLSGFIISLNLRRAMMGINTPQGVSIVEVLDEHQPVLGDAVTGALHSLGCRQLRNVTQAIRFDALIQEIHDDFIRMRNVLEDEPPMSTPAQ